MKTAHVKSLFVCLTCLIVSPSLAFWDEPILLSELNDFENNHKASSPVISSDECTILFSRHYPDENYSLWQAERNPDTGIFDQQRRLAELKNDGSYVFGSWLSEDKLRLYYAAADPDNLGWSARPIWMATRNSVNDTWQTITRHIELEIEALQVNCSLTADEKVIMYESIAEAGTADRRIFTAFRESINDSFSNLQEHYELEAIEAWVPNMSQDGLSVYFTVVNDDGYSDAWIGTRNSLEESFSNFAPIEEINVLASASTGTPFPGWDGKNLYFHQRQGESDDLTAKGIFVSHLLEAMAEENLLYAIEAKRVILEELTATIDVENETLDILNRLQEMTKKGSEEFNAIQKTITRIHNALQDEILAQNEIQDSICELEEALSYYRMEEIKALGISSFLRGNLVGVPRRGLSLNPAIPRLLYPCTHC